MTANHFHVVVALLLPLAAAFRPAALLQPTAVPAARASTAVRRASRVCLVDPLLAADATAALAPVAQSGLWEASWDAHNMDTLGSDLVHTTIYATLGLMGAYVTQARSATIFLTPHAALHSLLCSDEDLACSSLSAGYRSI